MKRSSFIKGVLNAILLLLLVVVMAGCGAGGGSTGGGPSIGGGIANNAATITWGTPSTKMDGSALYVNEIAGFKLHYGTESGNYTETIDTGFALNHTVENLSSGTTYYFAITCYDIYGKESGYSAEVNVAIL